MFSVPVRMLHLPCWHAVHVRICFCACAYHSLHGPLLQQLLQPCFTAVLYHPMYSALHQADRKAMGGMSLQPVLTM